MRFNRKALLVLGAFCLLLLLSPSRGSGWMSAGEAIASVLILLSLAGFMHDRRGTR